jgi:homoserine O-acetyltransferase
VRALRASPVDEEEEDAAVEKRSGGPADNEAEEGEPAVPLALPASAAPLPNMASRQLGDPPLFAVEAYLAHHGEKFLRRFDANCYVRLTQLMDSHDVSRGRGGSYDEVLRRIEQPTLVVGISSDVLYPVQEQRRMVREIPRAEFSLIDSDDGHDAFLIQVDAVNALVLAFLRKTLPQFYV